MRKEIIFSLIMANYLINEGFKIEKISENRKKKGFNVFIFNGSAELNKAIKKWYNIKKI